MCVDKTKSESISKGRKRPAADLEGEDDGKRKRERPESPSESVTSDSGSVADETEPNEPSSVEPVSYTHLDVYKRQFYVSSAIISSTVSHRKITRHTLQNTWF